MNAQEPPLLELRGITKAFPRVLANDSIDIDLRAGEAHALLGENGAGKSTLISILSGMYRPDAGEIRFEGREVEIDSPRGAIELGIGTVYQHLTLVPTLTVLENLMLGSHGGRGRLDVAGGRAAIRGALEAPRHRLLRRRARRRTGARAAAAGRDHEGPLAARVAGADPR